MLSHQTLNMKQGARVRKKTSENSQQSVEPANSVPLEGQRRASETEIAQRAYEIYQARGGEHGADFNDWLQAERELNEENSRSTLAAAATSAA
jgi:hypothetical protein